MVGASKINQQTDDLERLNEMFDAGLNNSQIARIYKTNSGESISRIHISQIRRGQRWNQSTRSFLMKDEIDVMNPIITELDGDIYQTSVGMVFLQGGEYYIYIHYKNGSVVNIHTLSQIQFKPTRSEILSYHNKQIFEDIAKV